MSHFVSVNVTLWHFYEVYRAEASAEVFALKGLYQSHKSYVADLYFNRYIATEEMVESIADQFGSLFDANNRDRELVKNDIRNALIMMNTDLDSSGDRPLAKLTRDIITEIEREYDKISQNKNS